MAGSSVPKIPSVLEGEQFPKCLFSPSLHQHALNPLPKERQGIEAAMNRILSFAPMMCSKCKLPAAKHSKVLVCDPCRFISCGKCVKKYGASSVIAIKPGSDPKLPNTNRFDEKTEGKKWIGYRQNHTGEIVFAKALIPRFEDRNDFLCDKFTFGEEIQARAFWPQAVRNIALGKIPDGKGGFLPVYGPDYIVTTTHGDKKNEHRLSFATFLRIDGKPYPSPGVPLLEEDSDLPEISPSEYEQQAKFQKLPAHDEDPTEVDFYAYLQSRRWGVFVPNQKTPEMVKFGNAFLKLEPGLHDITLELCFRVRPDEYSHTGNFPTAITPLSTPLAVGSFKLEITATSDAMKASISIFPQRAPDIKMSDQEATRIEKELLTLIEKSPEWGSRSPKTEQPVHLVLTSGWYRLEFIGESDWEYDEHGRKVKKKDRFAVSFKVVFIRRIATGWDENSCVEFDLSAENIGVSTKDHLFGGQFGVGGHEDIALDLVPEEIRKKYNI